MTALPYTPEDFASMDAGQFPTHSGERGRWRATLSARDAKIAELERENTVIRGLLVKYECPYGEKSLGECSRGFPGCACADDMLACMTCGPDDPAIATERLQKRAESAEARVRELEAERVVAGQMLQSCADVERIKDAALAASQARERELREALDCIFERTLTDDREGPELRAQNENVHLMARAVLAIPSDDSALRAFGVRVAEAIEDWVSDSSSYWGNSEDKTPIRLLIVDRVLGEGK